KWLEKTEIHLPLAILLRSSRTTKEKPVDPITMSQMFSSTVWKCGAGLLLLGLVAPVRAADAKPAELPDQVFAPAKTAPLSGLAVFPAEIQLTTARDRQSIVVQATFADGITRDVTREASLNLAEPKLVRRDGAVLSPV